MKHVEKYLTHNKRCVLAICVAEGDDRGEKWSEARLVAWAYP